jgi:hypothetical protein
MAYNNKSLNGESLLGKAMGVKNYLKAGVQNMSKAYNDAWTKSQNTPKAKKIRKQIEGGWRP